MLTNVLFTNPATVDGVLQFVTHSPHLSAVIGGIGLGNLFYHLPRFQKEKSQTIGIGALTAAYLLDSAAHLMVAGSSVGALGLATVGLLTVGSAIGTYAGIEWAGNQKGRKSKYATLGMAGFGTLHFGSHVYIAARGLLGTVYTATSLFGKGILGLAGNLVLAAVAVFTLINEIKTHGNNQEPSENAQPAGC